ncbi:hypothetical protein [Aquibacillus salsiterrae]|uniref:Uncharacterized protein n=1 Tax=Aquibacillus salsiterrae TaxID=2950439 RepID=A0A9X3WGL6_9BACI|nr:hypothetical protein [Aquibacillus salsiterrae]MDC3417074.1 hypothetical protein [Aquibacillus salsiterrae]
MSGLISGILYLFVLFGLASVLFYTLVSIWGTNEPVLAYLLSVISVHLVLHAFGEIGKK